MPEQIDEFTTAGGQKLVKEQYDNGAEVWRSPTTGQFRSQENVEQIRENTRQRNEARKQAIQQAFPELNNITGINPNKPRAGEKRNNIIRSFMDNQDFRTSVGNNPLLEGNKEREQALEARAREVLKAFEQADTQAEKEQIKRQYNLSS